MKIYKDVFSSDEMFSDAYPIKEIDDVVYEVEAKLIVVKEGDYGLAANVDEDAAEGATAEASKGEENKVINVIHAHHLNETQFGSSKDYLTYLKAYMGRIKKHLQENNPSRVEPFQAAANAFVKNKILPQFSKFKFYCGQNYDVDAGIALLYYKDEDPNKPIFIFFKDGLDMVKY